VGELDARVWVTSHHRAVLTERAAFDQALARFAAKVDERSQRLLGWLAEGPQELDQLARRGLLYPPGHDAAWTLSAERNTVRMHLEELLAQRLVRREGSLYAAG